MARHTILIIEDEPGIVDAVAYALSTEGFNTMRAGTGGGGIAMLAENRIDLVVLDIGLPDMSGFDVLKEIRSRSGVPVLFLTARAGEIDRILGLELGADDYVAKPFSPREVVSRVKAILRRSGGPGGVVPDTGTFAVDDKRRIIRYFGGDLSLTRYEFDLMKLLISRPGWVFSREQIMELVWVDPEESFERTVDAHVKSLRRKMRELRPDLDPIVTHRGVGYSLREDLCR